MGAAMLGGHVNNSGMSANPPHPNMNDPAFLPNAMFKVSTVDI